MEIKIDKKELISSFEHSDLILINNQDVYIYTADSNGQLFFLQINKKKIYSLFLQ